MAAVGLLRRAKTDALPNEQAAFTELQKEIERIGSYQGPPKSLVHPDFVLVNVVESLDGGFIPIDWAVSGIGPHIFSLTWLLFAASRSGKGMVDAVVSRYRFHIPIEYKELSRLSDSILTRQLIIAAWEVCNGRRKILEVVQKVPSIHKHSQNVARLATQAFTGVGDETQDVSAGQQDSNSPNPVQGVSQKGLYAAAVRTEESLRGNRLLSDPLA
jgi:hypothetical protein